MDDNEEHLFDLNGLGFTSTIDILFGSGGSAEEESDNKANIDEHNESNCNKDLEQQYINDVGFHPSDMDRQKTELDLMPDIDMDEAFMINIEDRNNGVKAPDSVVFGMSTHEANRSVCSNAINAVDVNAADRNNLQQETNDQLNIEPHTLIVNKAETSTNEVQLNKKLVNTESEQKAVSHEHKQMEVTETVSTNKHAGGSKSSSHRRKDESSQSRKSKEHNSHKSSSKTKSSSKKESSEKEKHGMSTKEEDGVVKADRKRHKGSKSDHSHKDSKSDHNQSSSSSKQSHSKPQTVKQDSGQKPTMNPIQTLSKETAHVSVEKTVPSSMQSNVNSAHETVKNNEKDTCLKSDKHVKHLKDDAKLKMSDAKQIPEIIDSNRTAIDENKQELDIEDELAKVVEESIAIEIEKELTHVSSIIENSETSASTKPETKSEGQKTLKGILKKQDSDSSVYTGELLMPNTSSQKQDSSKRLSISEYKNRKRKERVTDEMGSPPLKCAKTEYVDTKENSMGTTNEVSEQGITENINQSEKADSNLQDNADLPSESKYKLKHQDNEMNAENYKEKVSYEPNDDNDRSRDNSETKSFSETEEVKVKEETSDTGDQEFIYDDISEVEVGEDVDASDSDIMDDSEIYAMIEDGVEGKERPSRNKISSEKERQNLKEGECITSVKYVLEEKNQDPFDVLPQGWIKVNHNCGMPIYLHRPTRTVTLTRPYFLGESSLRGHAIPLSAIPCLQYKKAKEKEGSHTQDCNTTLTEDTQGGDATPTTAPPQGATAPAVDTTADIETGSSTVTEAEKIKESIAADTPAVPKVDLLSSVDMQKKGVLETEEVLDYCKKLFHFNAITVKKFKTWREKRSHLAEEAKNRKRMAVPRLGENSKLITCPLPVDEGVEPGKMKKKVLGYKSDAHFAFLLNPVGKTSLCILHEYAQNVLKTHPHYVFKEIENSENPFEASIIINNIHYASGIGQSKRQAKNNAAQNALCIFMPFMKDNLKVDRNDNFGYFENVPIEDPRVPELCEKAALNKPYQILADCLSRNHGLGNTNMQIDKKQISNQKTEFTLTVGKHKCSVIANNKREAKQQAAQVMLQKLHPSLTSWASILRMYSSAPKTNFAQAQPEPLESDTKKNFEILSNLKKAMLEMRQQLKQKEEQKKGDTASLASNAAVLNL
ncbi:dentin sialophosphoprotein-like isoform X1 [Dreissena polymorpha]|uniref:dentin sialophosphoprotein-like isoform X1 n=1 Tax=Dreissena polymorpha TaxID=45954 RepID=UPI0022641D97|nr:dentin sialophosphoprotein-like isoform X1 [Dreissena polymorpha]XP_052234410.1 dentin sialophosphoprotein-like isoform X1 [Dreissena polymorpha]